MAEARSLIEGLVERFGLSAEARLRLVAFSQLLADDPSAPTTVRDPELIIDHHIADSLVALELEQVRAATAIADIGSGAGLPGIPLGVALPAASVALVESARRKCEFLERALAACHVPNVGVVHSRVEEWSEGLARCDLVIARALAPLPVVVEYAAPLLRVGGMLVVWRGRREPDAEAAAADAASVVGLEPREIVPVSPFPGAEHRHLYLMSKVMETPASYPRRPGMASKRPLGASSDRLRR